MQNRGQEPEPGDEAGLARDERQGGSGTSVTMRNQVVEGIGVSGSPDAEGEGQRQEQPSNGVAALANDHEEADRRSTDRRSAVDDHL